MYTYVYLSLLLLIFHPTFLLLHRIRPVCFLAIFLQKFVTLLIRAGSETKYGNGWRCCGPMSRSYTPLFSLIIDYCFLCLTPRSTKLTQLLLTRAFSSCRVTCLVMMKARPSHWRLFVSFVCFFDSSVCARISVFFTKYSFVLCSCTLFYAEHISSKSSFNFIFISLLYYELILEFHNNYF